jgi:drug/metabolite transporter (DMT)-like permease
MAALGLTMAAAQFCFVNSMAHADASFVTPFTYLTLVFAGLYDALLFRVRPDAVSLLGAAVIVAGAALLTWRETVNRRLAATARGSAPTPPPRPQVAAPDPTPPH